MKTSYVDVAVRIKVTHGMDECPVELVNEADYSFSGDGIGETEIVDVQEAGTCNDDGTLIRDDGGTGRNVCLDHDPPIE